MKKIFWFFIFFVAVIIVTVFYINNSSSTKIAISYNGNNLRISIDDEASSVLPTSGTYYLVDYDCNNKNTKINWDKNNYTLDLVNGNKKGGVACYLTFKSRPLLNEMPSGSYVSYMGNNGCDDTNIVNGYTSCAGMNANYVNDNNRGYCYSAEYKSSVNGWRIGYIENDSVHLISAGAPECMCTDSTGTASNSSCSSYITSYDNLYHHYNNMDSIALKYCNKNYASGGLCNENTSWALNGEDFIKITGSSISYCYLKYCNVDCGWKNDLIYNGQYYWFGTPISSSSDSSYVWSPLNNTIFDYNKTSNYLYGVRPVLKLDSSVVVTGGSGTYTDPYIIDNNYFNINYDNLNAVELSLNSIEEDVTMCISVDTSECTNYIDFSNTYTLDLSTKSNGEVIVYVYYKDSNNKIIDIMSRSITIET